MNTTHTPGPYTVIHTARKVPRIVCAGPDGGLIARCDTNKPQAENEANARLIAAAPAQALILEMLALGLARFERSRTLLEFCFGGLRCACSDRDWTAVVSVIGWERAREAVAEGRGK